MEGSGGPLGRVADVMAGLLSASQASGMFTQGPPRGGPGPGQVTGQTTSSLPGADLNQPGRVSNMYQVVVYLGTRV